MSEVNDWAPLAADNTAAPPDGAPESVTKVRDVNDTLREMMAKMRRALSDQEAVTATLSGSQLTINGARTIPAYYSGLTVTAIPNAANVGAITARYNGLAYKAVTKAGTALAAGDLPANIPARLTYHNEAWHLLSPAGTTSHQANLDALASSMRFPVGAIVAFAVDTNPATLLGYGTWTPITGHLGAYGDIADAQGYTVNFPLDDYVGLNAIWPASYANLVPPHTHAIADHTHDMAHSHVQSSHGHYETQHQHAFDHTHRLPDATLVEVAFGSTNERRVKLTNDNSGTASFLPVSNLGVINTAGAIPAATGLNALTATQGQFASIGQPSPNTTGARALTTAANTPASGHIPNYPRTYGAAIWKRVA